MITHIGDNISLFDKDILVILDKESVELSKDNKNLIEYLINTGKLANKIEFGIKSYIIVSDKDNLKLYVSNISSTSLLNRQKDIDRRDTNE